MLNVAERPMLAGLRAGAGKVHTTMMDDQTGKDAPENAAGEIERFLQAGGKMICFYTLPQKLQPTVGIKRGRRIEQTYAGHFSSIVRSSGNVLAGLRDRATSQSGER